MLVYLNGRYLPRAEAMVSVDDRGFLFGDGVYEVTRARRGRLVDHARHAARLDSGLRALALAPHDFTGDSVRAIAERLLAENGMTAGEALVYQQVTRGAIAPRAHHYPSGVAPTVYVSATAFTPPDEIRLRGVSVITVPDLRWRRCDLKTINLLPNVMAKQQAVEAGAYEAIMLRDDTVTEGSTVSVLAVVAGTLRTHPLGPSVLPGVTRSVVLELARAEGIAVEERAVSALELPSVDELFITSTSNDVMPVVTVDGAPIGAGTPGPVTRRLIDAFRRREA
jgi:D-alanine transaminase